MSDHDPSSARDSSAVDGPFRIATVSELTGVPEPTLRAWERRYGIPSPERTASGYRLYNVTEVDQVREMRRLCDEGMAAAEAASLIRTKRAAPRAKAAPAADPYARMVEGILDAVERFDDDALDHAMRQLLVLGASSTIFDRVVAPALRAIGDRWHKGELGVAQEHLASQRLSGVLRDLARLGPGNEAAERVVLACFADDEHEIGLLGTSIRVAELGYRPVFLGSRTPPSAIRSAVAATSPRLVALSVTIAPARPRARELLEEYAAACATTPWLVGGAGAAAIADMVRKFGGQVAPEDDTDAARALRAALGGRPLTSTRGSKR